MDTSTIHADRLYLAAEVATILRCGKSNVYNLALSGAIAKTSIGSGKKGFRFKGSDILLFLDDRKEGGPSPLPSSYRHIGRFLTAR